MNILDTAIAYQQSTASAASSVGQVVALYDRILRDIRGAISAIGAGQIENRVNSLNHALTIIGELQGVLDHERGGEAARNARWTCCRNLSRCSHGFALRGHTWSGPCLRWSRHNGCGCPASRNLSMR